MEDKEQLLNGRYSLNRQLSTGGMGVVFEGFDTLLSTPVAIKRCLFDNEILRRAFEREAQLLANLSHRSLPYCIDLFTSGEHQYLVMKYIEGRTAEELLSDYPRGLPLEVVKDIAKQLLDVVEYLHSQLVLHRDIKTSNIKIKDGCVYLLDLGVAYGQIGEMNTVASGDLDYVCHSKHYSPPEQLVNERPSPAGDIYSTAATLYKLITGKAPEDAYSRLKHGEELTKPFTDRDSQDFVSGIMRALSLDRKSRPQNASEMRRIMFPDKPAPVVVNIPPRTTRSRKPVVITTVLVVTCLLSLAVFLWKRRSPDMPPTSVPQQQVMVLDHDHSGIREAAGLAFESKTRLEQGKEQQAQEKAARAVELDPENTTARRVLGKLARNAKRDEGNFELPSLEAQTHAKTIQEILSKRRDKLSLNEVIDLAWSELQLGEYGNDLTLLDKAIADASDVLHLQPNSVPALMIVTEASCEKYIREKKPQALKPFISKIKRVVEARPRYADAYVIKGNLEAALQDYESARKSYAQAAKLLPRAATCYLYAVTILRIKDPTEADLSLARDYLTQIIEKNLGFPNAKSHMAEVYDKMGETETADAFRRRTKAED